MILKKNGQMNWMKFSILAVGLVAVNLAQADTSVESTAQQICVEAAAKKVQIEKDSFTRAFSDDFYKDLANIPGSELRYNRSREITNLEKGFSKVLFSHSLNPDDYSKIEEDLKRKDITLQEIRRMSKKTVDYILAAAKSHEIANSPEFQNYIDENFPLKRNGYRFSDIMGMTDPSGIIEIQLTFVNVMDSSRNFNDLHAVVRMSIIPENLLEGDKYLRNDIRLVGDIKFRTYDAQADRIDREYQTKLENELSLREPLFYREAFASLSAHCQEVMNKVHQTRQGHLTSK